MKHVNLELETLEQRIAPWGLGIGGSVGVVIGGGAGVDVGGGDGGEESDDCHHTHHSTH